MFKSKKAVTAFSIFVSLIFVTFLTTWIVKSKNAETGTDLETEPYSINVAYSTDQNYVLPTLVSMTSLMENSAKNHFCKFTVLLSNEVSEQDKAKLKSVEENYKNCTVNLVEMNQQFANSEVRFWSRAMYYRLNLPQILKDEQKCIYLDGDTIVRSDLKSMNEIDMTNYYIAGIRDINCYINKESDHYKLLDIPNLDSYVCSGVLIMNLEKMRNDKLDVVLEDLIKENDINKKFKFPDQDALNKACYGHILTLPFKYGALFHAGLNEPFAKSEYAQWASNKTDWEEGRKKPVVLHFTGDKPWVKIASDFHKEWWTYADKTNFKDEIHARYNVSK